MPRYRKLTWEELKELEEDFVKYLSVNGITADEWVKIKKVKPEEADKIADLFSDVVWESVLRKVQFLEHRSPQTVKTFQCLEKKIVLMGLDVEDPTIDLTAKEGYRKVQEQMPQSRCYTSEKTYTDKREDELFKMIQEGCEITEGVLFKAIAMAVAEQHE